jgi:hypothetical protein
MVWKRFAFLLLGLLIAGTCHGCGGGPAGSPSPSSPTPTAIYSQYQLEYRLFDKYPDYFWCDPYLYPIGRPEQEQEDAQDQFPAIRSNGEEFAAILEHLSLAEKSNYSDSEKLTIFREHNLLIREVDLTPSGNIYTFSIRTGENQGLHIEGTITPSGEITVAKQEPSFNNCPICLIKGTLIATPGGPVQVENVVPGTVVFSLDAEGNHFAAPVVKVCSAPVPSSFKVIKVVLEDGRRVTASPGHPSADMRTLGSLRPGDTLDGSPIVEVEVMDYSGETYDLLPSGGTGLYWANGILLQSTLSGSHKG